jgi:hypothetical protein
MRSKTSATLILITTFAMGCITGATGHYVYQNRITLRAGKPAAQPTSQGVTGILGNYLDLDPAQKEQLKDILSRSRERYRALSQQFAPQYDIIRDETRQQIRAILHSDQQGKFEEFLRDMDKRRKERDSRP